MQTKKKLSPVVRQLKKWRDANSLSQHQASDVLTLNGLAVTLPALRQWEQGLRSPQTFTANVLETFLSQHPVVTNAPQYGRWPKVPEDLLPEIKALRENGATLLWIAERYGISESAVSRICGGSRRALKTNCGAT